MSKFDLGSIVGEVQKLYPKDKKSRDMIATGDVVKTAYTEKDGIALDPGHPFVMMIGLPCSPDDKMIQWAGDPDTGKSTMILLKMVAAQKQGRIVIIWDAEDKYDANRFRAFGGDPDQVIVVKSNEILQGGEKVRKIILAAKAKYPKAKFALCWDSIGGSQSRSHAERELDSKKHAQPGQDAKENGAVMRMLVALINKYPGDLAIIFANQVYTKMGFMQKGNKASGGKKVEFHSSVIIEMKRIKELHEVVDGVKYKIGIITRATVLKNHLSQGERSVAEMFFKITSNTVERCEAPKYAQKAEEEEEESE